MLCRAVADALAMRSCHGSIFTAGMLHRWVFGVVDSPTSHQQDGAATLLSSPARWNTSCWASCGSVVRQSRRSVALSAAPPHTDPRSATRSQPASHRSTARRRRSGRGGGFAPSEDGDGGGGDEDAEEDVEVFNLQTGWSVEALKEGLGAWNVVNDRAGSGGAVAAAPDCDLDDEDVDDGRSSWSTSNFAAFEDDDGWSLEPESAVDASEDAWSVTAEDVDATEDLDDLDDLDDDGVQLAKLAAQRALLSTIPDHVMRELEKHAEEAKAEAEKLKPANVRAAAKARRLHRRLRIISGSAAGRRLLSSQGDQTRPMMEMVRGAVFDILQGQLGCGSRLPDTGRWLDLYAGTGAVGIEGLSRGCREAHFVELDPRVARAVLEPNLATCDVSRAASVHVMRAEDFLRTAARLERFAGGAFDFISVCPPYELVDYNELYELLHASPLVKETTMIVVEYPRRLANLVRDSIGPLVKIRDRKYGRTMVAIYGPEEGRDSGPRQL